MIVLVRIENYQKMKDEVSLIEKYNVAGPRYTSYPTVPHWNKADFSEDAWGLNVQEVFRAKNTVEGISLYIHLPFCESLCTYCGCNTRITVNHAVEEVYISALLNEWELYLSLFESKPIITELHLGGGTPTFFSPANLARLISGIMEKAIKASEAEFSFEGHPNNTTEDHLRTLFDLGFRRVSFGIQDFDPVVQDIINRKQSFAQVEYVTDLSRMIGYTSVNFDLIYGLPLQTLASVINTVEKVKLLKPDRIAFYSYAHVPWIKKGQRRFTELDLPDNDTKRNLYETGFEMLQDAGYVEIGMDHFALPTDKLFLAKKNKTLNRNFMGYTTCETTMLIGLGCSSISDTGTAFAQNEKTVEKYLEAVNTFKLPVFNGHLLNQEDLVIRRHIKNVICKFETSWKELENQCESLYETIEELREMELDGLIEINDQKLEVTALGRPFVRNICMAFDEYLRKNKSETQLFSKVI